MSSPVRQMNQRRLPPLPGTSKRKHVANKRYATPSPQALSDMIVTGVSPVYSHHYEHTRGSSSAASHYQLVPDLSAELVSHYLNDNPEFLDNYVISHVQEDRIQQWSLRKSRQHRHHRHSAHSINGEIQREKRSKWRAFTVKIKILVEGTNGSPFKASYVLKWNNDLSSVQSNKWRVLHELTRDISQQTNKAQALTELANCAADSVYADGHNLYLIDDQNQLHCHSSSTSGHKRTPTCIGRIEPGSTVPAYVAYTKETIRTSDVHGDARFPEGLGIAGDKAQSVIAIPILYGNNGILGVLEIYRNYGNIPFCTEDEEVAASLLAWANMCVEYVEISTNITFWGNLAVQSLEMYNSMMKQRKLNEFLLTVTKSIFQDIVSMDTVIMKIMNYAKKLVNADRASLFLVDMKTQELYARIFDTGKVDENIPQKEIRFPMDKGVAGHVASTGHILNIPDAYMDDRFNRNVDLQTGYRTQTLLCMPIYIRGSIIGVVQMVNKLEGIFTKADEESFETFGIYCGLALHHAKLYDKIRRSEQKYKVAMDVLSYHSQCSPEEAEYLLKMQMPQNIPELLQYDFSPWAVENDEKPMFVLHMMRDIFSTTRFEINDLVHFTLTVKKNYRNVPYHNWAHAFSVAHAMFTVVKTANHMFTPLETLALYVACLCHDLDHRGKTNAFMVKSASPLAAIYSTSTMEHHHFNQTVMILQNDGNNIFKYLSSEEYKKILSDIKHCILATDLALFFSNRARLQELCDKDQFSWDDTEHRRLVMANSMTAADLCSMYKPWDIQLDLVYVIMEEFWQQGDEERSRGITPMAMMDREKQHELPHLEVGFLVGICLPCYELMARILPETKPMVDGATANLRKWKELGEQQKKPEYENPDRAQKYTVAKMSQSSEQMETDDEKQDKRSKDDEDVDQVFESKDDQSKDDKENDHDKENNELTQNTSDNENESSENVNNQNSQSSESTQKTLTGASQQNESENDVQTSDGRNEI